MRKPILIAAAFGLGLSGPAALAAGEESRVVKDAPVVIDIDVQPPAEMADERPADSDILLNEREDDLAAEPGAGPAEESETEIADLGAADAFVSEQADDQLLADDLVGKTVFNGQNENVGDVNDLLLDENGQIAAVVIGVGGFLGIGEKQVAVRFEAIELLQEPDNGAVVIVNGSREMLETAPDFTTVAQRQVETDALQVGQPPAPGQQPPPNVVN